MDFEVGTPSARPSRPERSRHRDHGQAAASRGRGHEPAQRGQCRRRDHREQLRRNCGPIPETRRSVTTWTWARTPISCRCQAGDRRHQRPRRRDGGADRAGVRPAVHGRGRDHHDRVRQRGLIAEWGLSWLLSRLVGPAAALDLLFSSARSRTEAASMGLVNPRCRARTCSRTLSSTCATSRDVVPDLDGDHGTQVYQQAHAGLRPPSARSFQLMLESFGRPDFGEGVRWPVERGRCRVRAPPRWAPGAGTGSEPRAYWYPWRTCRGPPLLLVKDLARPLPGAVDRARPGRRRGLVACRLQPRVKRASVSRPPVAAHPKTGTGRCPAAGRRTGRWPRSVRRRRWVASARSR